MSIPIDVDRGEQMTTKDPAAERKKFGWRVNEWSDAVGCSRASTYELIGAKKIESVKFGGARIIRTHPDDFLELLTSSAA